MSKFDHLLTTYQIHRLNEEELVNVFDCGDEDYCILI